MRSACTATGAGVLLDPERRLQEKVESARWMTIMMLTDNLVVNNCIIALEQNVLNHVNSPSGSRRSGSDDCGDLSLLTMKCLGHSAVLVVKPLMASTGVSNALVRQGHLLESGRVSKTYADAINAEIDSSFRYRQVTVLPQEAAEWQAKSRRIMELSRPARDLTPQDEVDILAIDNGDWDSWYITHWCVRGMCPLQCNGDGAKAKRTLKVRIQLSLGSMPMVPLEYRWKGMDAAAAWSLRARRQHDLLLRGLLRVFQPEKVRKAQQELVLAVADFANGANPIGDIGTFKAKQMVRGGKICEFHAKDYQAKRLEVACVLGGPVQHFLNSCFASDTLNEKYVNLLKLVPAAPTSPLPPTLVAELQAARAEAMSANLQMISGDRGRKVLSDMTELLTDFGCEAWRTLGVHAQTQFDACLGLLCACGSVYKRLVFDFGEPKFEVLKVASCSGLLYDDVSTQLSHVCDLKAKCDLCTDPYFCNIWIDRLMDRRSCKNAVECMKDMVSSLPLISAKCERKHIIGQETHKVKRGRALKCHTLSRVTYQTSVRNAARDLRQRVTEEVLPSLTARRAFSQAMTSHELGRGCQEGRRKAVAEAKTSKAKAAWKKAAHLSRGVKAISGYDKYHSSTCSSMSVGLSLGEKKKISGKRWRSMSDEQRSVYDAQAKAVNDSRQDFCNQHSTFGMLAGSGASELFSRHALRAMKDTTLAATLAELHGHSVFSSGVRFGCGIIVTPSPPHHSRF